MERITGFSQMGDHGLYLNQRGEVYSYGRGDMGQLGNGLLTDSDNLIKVAIPKTVSIGTGMLHSVALTKNGEVYVWGKNNINQLGSVLNERYRPIFSEPRKIESLGPISCITAGQSSTICLGKDGTVYILGVKNQALIVENQERQIGKVPGFPPMAKVTSGPEYISGLSIEGRVYGFRIFWTGKTGKEEAPHEILVEKKFYNRKANRRFIDIKSGAYHTLLLDEEGRVWGYGTNKMYQLGVQEETVFEGPTLIYGLPKIVEIGAGHFYGVARDEKGNIWYWGDNHVKTPTIAEGIEETVKAILFQKVGGLLLPIWELEKAVRRYFGNEINL